MRTILPTSVVSTTHRILAVFLAIASLASVAAAQQHRVQSVDVKVLSTMLADTAGIGEWVFSALVVADGHRILFDTGARPETVLNNARELKVDLTNVFGVENFLGAHCTGIEATYRIRELCGLSRKTAAVAAVGGGFTLGEGIHPGNISK